MNSQPNTPAKTPRSVIAAALVITLFMSLFVLEITDSIVNHRSVARSAFFFPPTAVLLWGVLTRCRWAWYAARIAMLVGICAFGATGIAAAWFFPAIKPRDQQGIIVISLILCTLLALAFAALGRRPARELFQVEKPI